MGSWINVCDRLPAIGMYRVKFDGKPYRGIAMWTGAGWLYFAKPRSDVTMWFEIG